MHILLAITVVCLSATIGIINNKDCPGNWFIGYIGGLTAGLLVGYGNLT